MTLRQDDVQRHRDVSAFPVEALLCVVRGGHSWLLASSHDTNSYGAMPGNARETRAREYNWECPCGRRKRELWDKVSGESTHDYGGGHLLMRGRPYADDARKEWSLRHPGEGIPREAAARILKAVD
jgi:hypothetical protein